MALLSTQEVGRRIRAARRAADMSQRDLADEIGVSQVLICFFETGRSRPKFDLIPLLAGALGLTEDELLVDEGKARAC